MAIDWKTIEKEYITSYISQRDIAKRHGISVPSVNNHATAGGWLQKREEYMAGKLADRNALKPKPSEIKGLLDPEEAETEGTSKNRGNFRKYALATLSLSKIDKNDPLQVEQRVNEYFSCCYQNNIKPQKPGLAKWLGISRTTLDRWHRGDFKKSTHQEIIEDAYTKLEEDLYDQLQSGGINPGSGIFLMKNMFGYKDVADVVVESRNPLGDLQDPEEIRKRIEACVVVDLEEVEE